jgi:hypothetical protein
MAYQLANLILNALVPVVVVLIGWKLNQRLKEIEQSQWANQKLVEKKLQLFDEIMPKLNDLYCFYMFVGHWKDISPSDVIDIKRFLDKEVVIYTPILGKEFARAYERFMDIAFETYASEGGDAKIKCVIAGLNGDRTIHSHYEWDPSWDRMFPNPGSFNKVPFQNAYDHVLRAFQRSIGIVAGELRL